MKRSFLSLSLLALAASPLALAAEEVVLEGRVTLGYCPFGAPICLLETDPGAESYRILGDLSTVVTCAGLLGRQVRVTGVLSTWECDPIEPGGGIGINPTSIVEIAPPPVCGDANGDGGVDLSDAVSLLVHLFQGGPAPAPASLGDVNGDLSLDLSDPIYLLERLFKGGDALRCP